jgi:hypothetical protein
MNNDPNIQNGPGGGNTFVQVIRFLLRLSVTAILVLALASLIWFGWQQLDRWKDGMSRRTVILESDTDYLLDQMATSQAQIALLTTRLALEQELAAAQGSTLSNQVEMQESAVHQIEELASLGGILSDTLSILVEGVAALQGDVNENMSQIDQIGGQADAAIIRSGTLETQLATLEAIASEPGEEVIQVQKALRWFHLREQISIAQLRLVASNPGLAAADVEQAFLIATAFQEESPDEDDRLLSIVIDRLDLALTSLPDDPASAARDLEAAWEAIDQVIVELLGIRPDMIGSDKIGLDNSATIEAGQTPTAVTGTPKTAPTQTPTPEG